MLSASLGVPDIFEVLMYSMVRKCPHVGAKFYPLHLGVTRVEVVSCDPYHGKQFHIQDSWFLIDS